MIENQTREAKDVKSKHIKKAKKYLEANKDTQEVKDILKQHEKSKLKKPQSETSPLKKQKPVIS